MIPIPRFALPTIVVTMSVALAVATPAQTGKGALPPQLDAYLTKAVKLSPDKRAQLLAGQPITRLLDSDPSREVAFFGAVWVNAPAPRYVALVEKGMAAALRTTNAALGRGGK